MRAVACLVSDSLWNGILLLECYYCLWNVTIACGMLLLLVECYLASSMCGMQLARFARTGLLASLALADFHRFSSISKIFPDVPRFSKIFVVFVDQPPASASEASKQVRAKGASCIPHIELAK